MTQAAEASLRRVHDAARWPGKGAQLDTILDLRADDWDEKCQRMAGRLARCGELAGLSSPVPLKARTWGRACDAVVCRHPPCQAHRTRETRTRLRACIAEALAQGKRVRLATFTLQHEGGTWATPRAACLELDRYLGQLRRPSTVEGRAKSQWDWYVDGAMASIECPRTAEGWHPHAHVVLTGDHWPRQRLREAWREATGGRGRVVDIREVAWRGRKDPETMDPVQLTQRTIETAVREVIKYVTKGLGDTGRGDARAWARSMRYYRFCRWWSGWYSHHPELTERDPGRMTATLDDWMRAADNPNEDLEVCVSGTAREVRAEWSRWGLWTDCRMTGHLRTFAADGTPRPRRIRRRRRRRPEGRRWRYYRPEPFERGRGLDVLVRVLALACCPVARMTGRLKLYRRTEVAAQVISDAWRRTARAADKLAKRRRELGLRGPPPDRLAMRARALAEPLPY